MLSGKNIGRDIQREIAENTPDKGSCIIILATDIPASDRQLRRIIKRCSVGLARLGSFIGHGSGEVFVGFSTANRVRAGEKRDIVELRQLNEERLDPVFRAAAECTEEAVLNSMVCAEPVVRLDGRRTESLAQYM